MQDIIHLKLIQIRCQLSHAGCVIKGDLKYGAPRSNPDGGICLQAHEIRFVHPVKKVPLCVSVPVPSSWKGVRQALSDAGLNTPPESLPYSV